MKSTLENRRAHGHGLDARGMQKARRRLDLGKPLLTFSLTLYEINSKSTSNSLSLSLNRYSFTLRRRPYSHASRIGFGYVDVSILPAFEQQRPLNIL